MPIATVELLVDKAYLVVGFRPAYRIDSATISGLYGIDRRGVLPRGLYDFSIPKDHCIQEPGLVTLQLPKNAQGRVDVLNMLVAADWLRDQGWEVVPLGWCAKVFAKVEGVAAK